MKPLPREAAGKESPRPDRWSAARLRAASRHRGHEDESILFVRPDSYGDLILFEPVLRWFRRHWPATRIGMLVRSAVQDVAPLLPSGVDWHFLDADPLHAPLHAVDAHPEIARMVHEFDPAVLVAASHGRTWLEVLAGLSVFDRRQVRLGGMSLELTVEDALRRAQIPLPLALFREVVDVDAAAPEIEKNHRLLSYLSGEDVPVEVPRVRVPPEARAEADQILAQWRFAPGKFLVCCPAGIANVALKSWPAAAFVETLRGILAQVSIDVVLMGSESEAGIIAEVESALRPGHAGVRTWLGKPGSLPVSAGILRHSRAYLGNDTGTLHLAAALRRRVAGIYGGGTWPRFQPAARASLAFVNPIPCFQCGWDCHFEKPLCVQAIQPRDVVDRCVALLRGRIKGPETITLGNVPESSFPLIASSRQKHEALQTERRAQARQVFELTRVVQQLTSDRAANEGELHAQLRESGGALAAAQNELELRMSQIEELTRTLLDREARLAALDVDLAHVNQLARKQADDHAMQIGNLQDQLASLAAMAKEQTNRLASLDHELADVNRIAREQAEQAAKIIAHLEQQRDAERAIEAENVSRLHGDLGEVTATLHQRDRQLAESHRQLEEVNQLAREQGAQGAAQLAALDRQLQELNALARSQAAESTAIIQRLERELAEVCTLLRASSERVAALDADLTHANQLARDEIAALQTQLEAAETEAINRGAEKAALEFELAQAAERTGHLTTQMSRLEHSLQERETQIVELQARTEDLIAERDRAEANARDLEQQITARDRELSHERTQLDVARAHIEQDRLRVAVLLREQERLGSARDDLLNARWTRIGIALRTLRPKLNDHS